MDLKRSTIIHNHEYLKTLQSKNTRISKTVYFKGWVALTTSHIKRLNWIVFAAHDNHAHVLFR